MGPRKKIITFHDAPPQLPGLAKKASFLAFKAKVFNLINFDAFFLTILYAKFRDTVVQKVENVKGRDFAATFWISKRIQKGLETYFL